MQFTAEVEWRRGQQDFAGQRYSRAHEWRFDGGLTVPASASPLSVPPPMSEPAHIDPEEALVAAVSSCHMLFFLSIAAKRGFVVDSYRDDPIGELGKLDNGRMAMTRFTLRPSIVFAGVAPTPPQLDAIHHQAHEQCYIANSLNAAVVIAAAPA